MGIGRRRGRRSRILRVTPASSDHRYLPEDPVHARGVLQNNYLNWLPARDVECSGRPVAVTDPDAQQQFEALLGCAEQIYGAELDAYFGPSDFPDLIFYAGTAESPCGTLANYWGYFCGSSDADGRESTIIYLNTGTLSEEPDILVTQTLFHEYAHYLQWRTGNLLAQRQWPEDSTTTTKRSESQVECLSGTLLGRVASTRLTEQDYAWYDEVFAAGGEVPGYGTGAERWAWIWAGYNTGEASTCNTWALDRI